MKAARRSASVRPRSAAPVDWRRTASVTLWLAVVTGLGAGFYQLDAYAASLQRSQPVALVWSNLPDWLKQPGWRFVTEEIERVADVRADDDLRDPNLAERVAAQVLTSPWIKRLRRVSAHADGTVRIDAEFRQPLALIDYKNMAYPVDDEGVRLPFRTMRTEDANTDRYFPIRGVRAAVPAEGQVWPGEDVQAALKLIRFLEGRGINQLPLRAALRAIDVANFNRREDPRGGVIRIRTIHERSYIHWGFPPGSVEEYDIEATADRKLDALLRLFAERSQLPDEGPIDVRAGMFIWKGEPERNPGQPRQEPRP